MSKPVKRRIAPVPVQSTAGGDLAAGLQPAVDAAADSWLWQPVNGPVPNAPPGRRIYIDISKNPVVSYAQLLKDQGIAKAKGKPAEPAGGGGGPPALAGPSGLPAMPPGGLELPTERKGGRSLIQDVISKWEHINFEDSADESGEGESGSESGSGSGGSEDNSDDSDDEGEERSADEAAAAGAAVVAPAEVGDAAAVDGGATAKKRRGPRFVGYEADFIDDSEVMRYKYRPKGKAKYEGFAVIRGDLEDEVEAPPEEAAPPRKRPSKKPQAEGGVPAQGGEEPAAKKKRIRPKSTEGAAEGERAAKAARPEDVAGPSSAAPPAPGAAQAPAAAAAAKQVKRLQPQPLSVAAMAAAAGQRAAAGAGTSVLPPSIPLASPLAQSQQPGASQPSSQLPAAGTPSTPTLPAAAGEGSPAKPKSEPAYGMADAVVAQLRMALNQCAGQPPAGPLGLPEAATRAFEEMACVVNQYCSRLPALRAYTIIALGTALDGYVPRDELEARMSAAISGLEADLAAKKQRLAGLVAAAPSTPPKALPEASQEGDVAEFKFQWSRPLQDAVYEVVDLYSRMHGSRSSSKVIGELLGLWPSGVMSADELKKQYQTAKRRKDAASKPAGAGKKAAKPQPAVPASPGGGSQAPSAAGTSGAAMAPLGLASAASAASPVAPACLPPALPPDMADYAARATAAGADAARLAATYATVPAGHTQKIFKALCTAGAEGLDGKGIIECVNSLGLDNWEATSNRRSSISQLLNNKATDAFVHVGNSRYALSAFPGAVAKPKKQFGRAAGTAAVGLEQSKPPAGPAEPSGTAD